ncbi:MULTISPECIES: adenylate/guanylate cyclase domain-containing protein [Bradyrhizobium]|uniref:adenylate/guanylate cyclase domain-containing protein n=1 Tax=Bradyrhizobium elkanii TaxID=29448 RepID=UPI0004286B48|nr:adenylate/guanylate cyclase domain-containing protein [Bradyrhizobium elkanii]
MAEARVGRRLAAIVAADVAGYSRLMSFDEVGTAHTLREHRAVIDALVAKRGGRIVKTTGDGVLLEFPSVVDAVECAAAMQVVMVQRNNGIPEARRMLFRIGINLGDILIEGDDILGDGVNVAARLEGIAEPGGICISASVYDQVRGKVTVEFIDRGEQRLKNINRLVRVYATKSISNFGTVAPDMPPPHPQIHESLPLPDKPSIAVLPFQNMSGDPEQEYFACGIVEDIITALSRIRWLFVIAHNSSFTYSGHAVDVKQAGRELGVRYVLEGSVRKGGNRIRITGQLIDGLTGVHLWAERYDRDLGDIFAVQDEIAASVAAVIEPALAAAEQERVLRKPPERLDAWEAYQRGLWHLHKYRPQENKAALAFFSQAIALDPNFAPGHYGYALALQWDIWHFSSRPFLEVQETAREEAQIAVSLDDKDAVAHAVLAHMLMWGSEWEAAIAEARTAIALNPNSAFVISMLGCVLGFGGYREEALERLQQAMRASPHDPLIWLWLIWRGLLQFFSRDFIAALQTLRQVARLRPGYAVTSQYLAASLAYLGRSDEARETLERIPPQSADQLQRWQQRPPWMRPEDYALLVEGFGLAAGERR